jgi:hypothetical protein
MITARGLVQRVITCTTADASGFVVGGLAMQLCVAAENSVNEQISRTIMMSRNLNVHECHE